MSPIPHPPEPNDPHATDPRQELSPRLREAVDQVRAEPVSPEHVEQAVGRAARPPALPASPPSWAGRAERFLLAIAALAAAVLVALGGWYVVSRYQDTRQAEQAAHQAARQAEEPKAEQIEQMAQEQARRAKKATRDLTVAPPVPLTTAEGGRTTPRPGLDAEVRTSPAPDGTQATGTGPAPPPSPGDVPTRKFDQPAGPGRPVGLTPVNPVSGLERGTDVSLPSGNQGPPPPSTPGLPPLVTSPTPATPSSSAPIPTDTTKSLPVADPGRPESGYKAGSGSQVQGAGKDSEDSRADGKPGGKPRGKSEENKPGEASPGEGKSGETKGKQTLGDLAQQWGRLPEAQRAEQLQNFTKNLSEVQQKIVKEHLDALARNEPAPQLPPGVVIPPPAPPTEGATAESYSHFVDNPYQTVRTSPLSTFSITVDSASYSNVRRFLLQEGRLPPADAVRVAELVNYFPYSYPQPEGEHPVTITSNITQCPWTPKHHLIRVALKAKEYHPGNMPARNFVFLLDTSGSMSSENKLPLLRQSLKLLVENLTEKDRVAIVVYAGSAGLVLPSTPGSEKQKIVDALDRLHAGGSTNGGQGIQLAYQVAEDNLIKGGLNRVILGSDGDFNVGVTSQGELVRLIEARRKTGIYLSILGFGMGNYKDSTMEQLAKHGNGQHAYIDTLAEARKLFVEQGAALVTVAKDVKLQLEFNPQMVAGYRLIGYENRMLQAEDFNDDTKDASEMGAGHTVTALYEVVPAGQPVPGANVDPLKYQQPNGPSPAADSGEWLTVKLRYKDPDADASKLLASPLTGAVGKFDAAPEDFRFAASVASFGMLLRKSEYAGKTTFAAVKEIAASSLGKDPNGHRKAFLEMVEAAGKLSGK